jgi:hypothetical protein
MLYTISFSTWVGKVEMLLDTMLPPSKYVLFFDFWFGGYLPRDGYFYYLLLSGVTQDKLWEMK